MAASTRRADAAHFHPRPAYNLTPNSASGIERATDWHTASSSDNDIKFHFCVNREICIFSASAGPMQLSTKDDSFTMLGAPLMARIVNPAVPHSDRPSALYGVIFEALGSIPSGPRRS
jgi:hypothetical protein